MNRTLSKHKILITGATGFVGKTLIPVLSNTDLFDIAILVRSIKKAKELFGNVATLTIIPLVDGWTDAVKDFNAETVLHMATCFSSKSDSDSLTEIINTNILFSTRLLYTLQDTACKNFINIGTFSEYQFGGGEFKANNLYSASKTALRPIIRFFQEYIGFKWINVIIYSPYGRINSSKKIVDYLVDAVGSKNPIAFSEGKQILDFIHVDDIADFFVTLLRKLPLLSADFYEFHLGTGQGHSLCEVANVISEVFGEEVNADWGKLPYRKNDIMHAIAPVAKNMEILGWSASISLEEGITILKGDMLKLINGGG